AGGRRRGRGTTHGGMLRPPGGARAASDRTRHPLSAGHDRTALRSHARAHRRGDRPRGRLLMPVRDFLLPDLGEGLEDAEVLQWLVSEGDRVELNQPLVEVNTAKATVEIPSPWAGTVERLHAAPGDVVAVGSPLVSVRVDDGAEAAKTGRRPVLEGYGVQEPDE